MVERLPEKGSPEWHRLKIARATVKMSPEGAALMGGMTMEEAKAIVEKYDGPKVIYANAHELWKALDRGSATIFTYNDESFHVRKPSFAQTEITDSDGNLAFCPFYFSALLDYQGIAANLQKMRSSLIFDKEGNLVTFSGPVKWGGVDLEGLKKIENVSTGEMDWKDQVEALHEEAMKIMEAWEFNIDPAVRKDKAAGKAAALKAVQLEKKAAELIPFGPENEPSRSVMYRSAASLAVMAGFWMMAVVIANEGIRGAIHPEIVKELEDVRNEAQGLFDQWIKDGAPKERNKEEY